MKRVRASRGFTLVELLIVIVVIAILAAITIVAYGGVTNKAHQTAVESTLKQATTQLEEENVNTGSYPADQSSAALKSSSDITLNYFKQSDGNNYCLDATEGTIVYAVTNQNTAPQQGDCSQAGLVAEWKLNGDATDAIGSANGTVTGTTTTTGQDGKSGHALAFGGTSADYVTTPDTNLPVGTADRAVFAWVNFATLPSAAWAMIDSYGSVSPSPNGSAMTLGVNTADQPSCVASNDTFSASTAITAGTWYLIGCEISNNGTTATVYTNATSKTGAMPTPISTVSSGSNYIGRYISANYFVTGSIDDVRIFNRALSAGEVQEMIVDGAS